MTRRTQIRSAAATAGAQAQEAEPLTSDASVGPARFHARRTEPELVRVLSPPLVGCSSDESGGAAGRGGVPIDTAALQAAHLKVPGRAARKDTCTSRACQCSLWRGLPRRTQGERRSQQQQQRQMLQRVGGSRSSFDAYTPRVMCRCCASLSPPPSAALSAGSRSSRARQTTRSQLCCIIVMHLHALPCAAASTAAGHERKRPLNLRCTEGVSRQGESFAVSTVYRRARSR